MSEQDRATRGVSRRRFLSSSAAGLGCGLLAAPAARGAGFLGASERVRVGFIGVGGRGTTHLRTLLSLGGAEVTRVCDIEDGRMEAAARLIEERTGREPGRSRSHHALLAARDVDAVLVATPCDIHARQYLDTIAAGKDLYAEKPMAITAEECDAVVTAAKASKCVVQVGFQSRYDARIREGMERIHRGDFGEILEMRGSYLAHFGPLRDWRSYRARSGDWMVEQAVHFFDIMNWAFRCTPRKAFGWGRTDVFTEGEPDRDVTDYYSALIEYPGGVIVNWLHSWLCPAGGKFNRNTMQFMGRKGGVDVNDGQIEYMDRGRAKETLREPDGNSTASAQSAFLECVRERRAPLAGVEEGRDAVLVALMVRAAVYGRRVTMFDEIRAV